MDGYQRLANAIVYYGVMDYIKGYTDEDEFHDWLYSDYVAILTDADKDYIYEQAKKRRKAYAERKKKKSEKFKESRNF